MSMSCATISAQTEETVTFSGTLPVMYIETADAKPITSKEDYSKATCYVDALGLNGYESLGDKENPITLLIKGHGNWTWTSFEKKSYRLKFDKKQALMGLNKNKHFVLLAHADDNVAFLRNTVGFELSKRLGFDWTPEQRPIEVMLNGEYIGLYFLTEKIRVDKDRVNITEQADNETDETKITGGWLVEIDNYDDESQIKIDVSQTNLDALRITYHSPEILSNIQASYLQDQFDRILKAVYTADKTSAEWEELIDMESLVRYYVLSEAIDHIEAFWGSCYLHKNLGETKWKLGPVWDLGHAFNAFHSKQKFIYDYPVWGHCIIEEIAKFPNFQAKVNKVWNELYKDIYPTMNLFIDDFIHQIEVAASYNAARWPQYGNSDVLAAAETVKQRFDEKMQWLATQWNNDPSSINVIPQNLNTPSNEINLSGIKNTTSKIRIVSIQNNDGQWKRKKIMR